MKLLGSEQNLRQSIRELRAHIEGVLEGRKDPLGLSLALTTDKGLIWTEGFGFTDHSRSKQVTPETLFSTQSMGKCFTATAFLIMASKGLVHLDESIKKYYPEFTVNTVHGTPEAEIEKITFRRMLSHMAGFTHEASIGNNYDTSPCSFEDHIRSIGEGWLKSPVGSEMSYSNLGYDLTAYVMGLIANKSFPEVMNDVLFKPLEITNATFDIDVALGKSFAKGYDGFFGFPTVQVPMLGAGGLFISAVDVAKLISFHLKQGRIGNDQIIKPNLLWEMYTSQIHGANEYGYGFGLYSAERIGGHKAYGHAGGGYGYQTNMLWLPDMKIGVVVLSNNMKQSHVGGIAQKALELILRETEIDGFPYGVSESLRCFSGTYCADGNLAPHLLRISSTDESLIVSLMDGRRAELSQQSSIEFSSSSGTRYSFLMENGRPKEVRVDNSIFPYRAGYNDGPNDEKGPNKEEWDEYLGIYLFEEDARPNYLAILTINGYLYLSFRDNLKLYQHVDNRYFTAAAEVLTLGEEELNYRGITAKKIDYDISDLIDEIKHNELKYDYYHLAVMNLVNIWYTLHGLNDTLEFIQELAKIDREFEICFSHLGKRLYAQDLALDAKKCFEKLLEFDPENQAAKEFLQQIIG